MFNVLGKLPLTTLLIFSLALLSHTVAARTIHIVGDSTASHYGKDVFPRTGWGQALASFYAGQHTVNNLAQSGRSSKSFIDEGFFDQLAQSLQSGDLLLIQFGHNDAKKHSPERYSEANTDFKKNLTKYLEVATQKQATAVLLTPVVRRKFEEGKLLATHGAYPQAVRDLAEQSGTALIDMTELSRQLVSSLGEQASKAIYLHHSKGDEKIVDNTHFSEHGAYRIAALVAQQLDSLGLVPLSTELPRFVRVEKDGSADFTRIQDALTMLKKTTGPAIVLIGEGVFDEQLFITRDHITLLGKGRDRTTIKTTLLRADWRTTHDDDWGAATLNLKASDVTFMRLRVLNDVGIVGGDHSHQFALRLLEGSRIISEDSTFITGGADTVSLWNKDNGMYYHRRAYFEGYTDFVCPRGWSYITDSEFFSRGGAAAIWHDGQRDENQKLVIKDSSFDGVQNFILGRRHYDAQFYLINNRYSENLADQPIFRVTYADKSRNRPNNWGDRTYFFGSVKQGKSYSWLNDNISAQQADVSALASFNGQWDPESKLAILKAQIARYETKLAQNSQKPIR